MATEPAIIFTGGDPPPDVVVDRLPRGGFVIAADAGWHNAMVAHRVPDILVGDMDSISHEHLNDARGRGVEIITHSPHKDFTDAEIALDLAEGRGHDSIILVSGGGDRFDHLMALVHSVVSHSRTCLLEVYVGRMHISFVHGGDSRTFDAVAGDTVSLIPLGGDATGVTTTGLQWELSGDTLHSFASRGVSNQARASHFDISIDNGHLAVMRPLDI